MQVVLGIDIGGTTTKIGLVDKAGNILGETVTPTPANTSGISPEGFVLQLHDAIAALRSKLTEVCEVVSTGIGAPNGSYYKGTIEYAANLPWQHEVAPIAQLFEKYYPGIPVKLTNDAKAAALGEMIYGGARGMRDFIVVTLGTGFGSGIVCGGALLYGSDSFAGELGHTIINPNGRHCGCGRRGCLETYVSATGLKQTAFEVMSARYFTEPSALKRLSFLDMTAKDIADAAAQGDSMALEVFDKTAQMLALGLANAIAITGPEAIFIYGGLAKSGDLLLAPTRKYLNEAALKNFCKRDEKGNILREAKAQVLLSELNDKNGALLGAAALAWEEMEKR
ncbi:MAG: ROK family protein [Prevotellaceae bacterium]|jgi:glucokinase|nr:ROK family protein [Prevotellaceae bacterium]